jgi:hypothetical protein
MCVCLLNDKNDNKLLLFLTSKKEETICFNRRPYLESASQGV